MRNWISTNGRDLLIIILAFIAILYILNQVMGKFTTSGDMVAVLGGVLPIISTVAAAAIGVSVGTTTGAKAANERMAAIKKEVTPRLHDLQNNMHQVHSQITVNPPVGDMHILYADTSGSQQIQVASATLNKMETDIAHIGGALAILP